MADHDDAGGGGFITGLLLGLLAGATLAMVSAPQSGEETRDVLRAKARDLSETMNGQTSELLERGRAIVERARARVDGAVAEGLDAAEQQRNELQSRT